jgi:Fe-coproporphyrin III synthase
MKAKSVSAVLGSVLSRRIHMKPAGLPFIIAWVTARCNLRCSMCDEWKRKSYSAEMKTEDWYNVIGSARKLGTAVFTITGGEPFMRKDITDIIRAVRKNGIGCHVCTNGTLLTEPQVLKMKASPPDTISVSIDGLSDTHNSLRGKECYNQAIQGIRNVKRHLPTKVSINFILSKKNYSQLGQVLALSRQLGVGRFNVQPIHTNLRHRDKPLSEYEGLLIEKDDMLLFEAEFRRYMDEVGSRTSSRAYLKGIPAYLRGNSRRQTCHAGYISCAIDATGGVSVCDGMDAVANVRDMPLQKIWTSDAFHEQRKQVHACKSNCWDTTHANLNTLLSPKAIVNDLPALISSIRHHG